MTTKYNIDDLRSTHLVNFSKPDDKLIYYYDFDTNSWRPCRPIEKLPYDIIMFKFMDTPDDNTVIATCSDSYRLANEPDTLTKEEMIREQEWRDKLIQQGKGAEMDFYSNKYKTWVKAQIAWLKSDVIPGVMNITHRKTNYGLGYYYKESTKLAKSSTYTTRYTEEEINEEMKQEDEAREKKENENIKINDILNTLDKMVYNCIDVYDYIPYYRKLNLTDKIVTFEEFRDGGLNIEKWKDNDIFIKIFGTLFLRPEIDGIYFTDTKSLMYNEYSKSYYCDLNSGGDCCYDIKINGLDKNKVDKIIVDCNGEEVSEAIWNNNENCFVFKDFTKKYPLIHTMSGASIRLVFNGLKEDAKNIIVKYNAILFSIIPHKIIMINNGYAVTYIKSKDSYLFAGHYWNPSIILKTEKIKILEPHEREKLSVVKENNTVCMTQSEPTDFRPLI
jgi:hypothetical protein